MSTLEVGNVAARPLGNPELADLKRMAWRMVALATIATMCCSTPVVMMSMGVFIHPLASSFGWGRGAISLSFSAGAIAMILANPVVGRLIDNFGVKAVLIISFIATGIATAAVPLAIQFAGINGLYASIALIMATGAGCNVIAYVRLLSGWFSGPLNGWRGLALGISAAGLPLGGSVISPIAALIVEHLGWRWGFWGLAFFPLCIGLPVAIFGLRSSPYEGASEQGSERTSGPPGMSIAEALRTRAFWLLAGIALLMSMCLQGVVVHLVPLMQDLGISASLLALVLAATGATGVLAQIIAGHMFDRYFAPLAALVLYAMAAGASFMLMGFPGLVVALIASFLLAVGQGAESGFIGYVVGRYFGLKNFGQIFGALYACFWVGIAIGPYLVGLAFDHFGNYRLAFGGTGGGLIGICILLLCLPRFSDDSGAPICRR